jgi:hypothetical protein
MHKQKLQQTSSAVKDILQKGVYVTLDPGDCQESEILEIRHVGEYERLLQNAKLKLVISDSSRIFKFISLITPQAINKEGRY